MNNNSSSIKIKEFRRLALITIKHKVYSQINFIVTFHSVVYLQLYNTYSRGARAQSVPVNATGCGFDAHSRK